MSLCDNCIHRFPCDNESDFVKQCDFFEEERPHGEWIDFQEDGYVECPFCGSMIECDGNKDELHYCFSCGAELS